MTDILGKEEYPYIAEDKSPSCTFGCFDVH
jgi:hypothetical protein